MAEAEHPPPQPALPPPLPPTPKRQPPRQFVGQAWERARSAWRTPAVRVAVVAVAAVAVFVVVLCLFLRARERRVLAWRQIAIREAHAAGLDPALVLAVIRAESGGEPRAVSRSGAIGLMQLMPATAAVVARKLGLEAPTRERLFDPETNIRLGTRYLAQLRRQFCDEPWLYVAAYNAGPGNVDKWVLQNPDLSPREIVERVAFDETRAYVFRVLAFWEEFRTSLGTVADTSESGQVGE